VPLIEIVSEPDIRSPEEAASYLKKIRQQVRYLGISDGNMEEGSLRCDANISLRPMGREDFGVRAELKNMNSFRNVQKALEFEIRRQTALLLDGHKIVQETRLWDAVKGVTVPMRGKEEAHDYRYFPDPDLVPVKIDNAWMDSVKAELPELPDAKCARFEEQYGLTGYDAGVLTTSRSLADYFEECVALFPSPKIVSNWVMVELFRLLKQQDREIDACPIPPAGLAELLKLIDDGTISGKMAKDILEQAYDSKKSPKEIVEEQGVAQVSDESTLSAVVEQVVEAHPEEVEKCKAGKTKILGFLVGQVMKETKGQANPKKVNELLRKALGP
jgi:aspartyl-tRNA(Asn)/glutamyl-tRNA(Gln) amidotransferase subunit B